MPGRCADAQSVRNRGWWPSGVRSIHGGSDEWVVEGRGTKL